MKKEKKLLFSVGMKDLEMQTFSVGGPGGGGKDTSNSGVRLIHHSSGARGEIETAPKDSTRILLVSIQDEGLGPNGPISVPPAVHLGYWDLEGDSWVDECDSFDGDVHHLKVTGVWSSRSGWFQPNEVSDWMPLPAPPVACSCTFNDDPTFNWEGQCGYCGDTRA